MPGQRGSETRRLSGVVTLRLSDDLAQRCGLVAAERGLSLAGWFRSIAAAQTSDMITSASGCGAKAAIMGCYPQRRAPIRQTVPRRPEWFIAELVRIADGLADLNTLLAPLRAGETLREKSINAALVKNRDLSALVTSMIERGRDDQRR